jgi:hypothetical protein
MTIAIKLREVAYPSLLAARLIRDNIFAKKQRTYGQRIYAPQRAAWLSKTHEDL